MQKQELLTRRPSLRSRSKHSTTSSSKSQLEPLCLPSSSQETLADSSDSIPSYASVVPCGRNTTATARIHTPAIGVFKAPPLRGAPFKSELRSIEGSSSTSSSLSSLSDCNGSSSRSSSNMNSVSSSLSSLNRIGSGLSTLRTSNAAAAAAVKKRNGPPFMNQSESLEAIAHEIQILKIAKDKMGGGVVHERSSKLGRTDSDECSVVDVFGLKAERRSGVVVDRE
ncbi:hypothetical protein BDR26DRAFT_78353 [Obelidium mucronatum]|nr:hypothetical protein BDR26DRAFT_78353 [Obelidium mucronatum]